MGSEPLIGDLSVTLLLILGCLGLHYYFIENILFLAFGDDDVAFISGNISNEDEESFDLGDCSTVKLCYF